MTSSERGVKAMEDNMITPEWVTNPTYWQEREVEEEEYQNYLIDRDDGLKEDER